MTVAAFVTNISEIATVVPWAARIAAAQDNQLVIVVPKKSKGKQCWNLIENADQAEDSAILKKLLASQSELNCHWLQKPDDADPPVGGNIQIREIISPDPESAFVLAMKDFDVQFLVIPGREPSKNPVDEESWLYQLLNESPCPTLLVRGTDHVPNHELNIVVASDGSPDTDIALDQAEKIVSRFGGDLSLLYIRPDDDRLALQVARYQLERLDRDVRTDIQNLPKTIVLQDDINIALQKHCQNREPDLVIVGTRDLRDIRSLMRPWKNPDCRTSLAIIRDGVPFSSRMLNELRLWIGSRVPQMNRQSRIELVDRLNLNSNFDFDFVALIVLSTMIAALGLVQNSVAVVIGAMLVAPLMTPLVGIGFSLVQGNEKLVKTAVKSVLSGFAVAFLVGAAIGLLLTISSHVGLLGVPVDVSNEQIQARGHPTLLDWFVAFVSGAAAAYAIGRPNLVSALPGVAIAAALVPPIASSGIAFAVGDFQLSLGSLLLFSTNIVAIALGTAVTFWMVGVSANVEAKQQQGKQQSNWPRHVFLAFVILSLVLAALMTWRNRLESEAESKPLDRVKIARRT